MSSANRPLLEARGIRKVFHRVEQDLVVLDGCDLVLEKGRAVAVVGSSGSGKSTLLNILGTLDHPSAGEVLFRGENLADWGRSRIDDWRSRSIGFVFQTSMLLPDFTALENILIPARRIGALAPDQKDRARHFLDITGLADRAHHRPGELSGGEQQRVAVARAFMNRPDMVLADEPFGNLDREIGGQLGEMLFRLRDEEGTSLVIVTHDPRLAARADSTLELVGGKLQAQSPREPA